MQQFLVIISCFCTAILISLSSCDQGCAMMDCLNGGECFEGNCICQKWFSGEECQLSYNRNYEGTYVGQFTDDARSEVEAFVVTASDEVPNRMEIDNGIYFEFVDEELLVIPRQQIIAVADTFIVEGSGTYAPDVLTFDFVRHADDGVDNVGPVPSFSFEGERIN